MGGGKRATLPRSASRFPSQRCAVTPTCRQYSSTGHTEHFGRLPVHTCFPNGTSSRLISTQYLRGSRSSSTRRVASGEGAVTKPHLLVTRWTWMSTLISVAPQAIPRVRFAHFGPTPRKDVITSKSHGSSPPYSAATRSAGSLMLYALVS